MIEPIAKAKTIRSHDPRWQHAFAAEAQSLRDVMGEAVVALHHIGSTAVPGLLAKPIIDILAEARSLENIDARNGRMVARGYDARGAYGIEGRRYFSRKVAVDDVYGFHVHVYQTGSAQITRHLRFRDFLRTRQDLVEQYATLKRSLCDGQGRLVADYAVRKAALVGEIEAMAMLHFGSEPE